MLMKFHFPTFNFSHSLDELFLNLRIFNENE